MEFVRFMSEAAAQAYEKALFNKVKQGPIPNHLAIIMDGNRRFAQKLGIDPSEGHMRGRERLKDVLEWCQQLGIKIVTVYAFSTENLKRNPHEVKYLMKLFAQTFRDAGDDERVHKHKVKIKAIGNISLLDKEVQDAIKYAEKKTENYNEYILNIAIAYGSREEIIQAIKKIAKDVQMGKVKIEDINEDFVSGYLYTSELPDPDLIIRTSGEERISNFLLWQMAYSELYFADVFWPELTKIDFLRIIRSYQRRQRRFGV